VQEVRGVARGVPLRDARRAEAEMDLLQILLVHGDGRVWRRRTAVDRDRPSAETAEDARRDLDQVRVREVAGARDQDPIRAVARLEEGEEIVASQAGDRLGAAGDGSRQWVAGPEREVEELVDVIVRR